MAVENNDKDIVKLFLEYEYLIDPNYRNFLKHSLYICEGDAFTFLHIQKTPLSIAVENNNKEMVELLLQFSCIDVNIILKKRVCDYTVYFHESRSEIKKRTQKITALDIAKKNENQEIYNLLNRKLQNIDSDLEHSDS